MENLQFTLKLNHPHLPNTATLITSAKSTEFSASLTPPKVKDYSTYLLIRIENALLNCATVKKIGAMYNTLN